MSRPLRIHAPNRLHHVFARGNDKECIFRNDDDYARFLELLAIVSARFQVTCVWFCLLFNHFHLAVVVSEKFPLWRMMQQLNSRYCQTFNRGHRRVGHLLQGRYGCRIVDDEDYARTLFRYLALNPVLAGQARTPEEWPWSSCRAVMGLAPAPEFLKFERIWRAFATTDPLVGRDRLRRYLDVADSFEFPNPLLFGSEFLASYAAPKIEPHQGDCEFAYAFRYAARPPLEVLVARCETRADLERGLYDAHNRHGYTLADLARRVGKHPSTIWRWIARVGNSTVPATPTSG